MKFRIIIVLILVFLVSCDSNTSWRYLFRSASSSSNIEKVKKDTSFAKNYGAKILSQTILDDSLDFKCFNVKIQLPKDTSNYLTFLSIGLPSLMGIDNLPRITIKTAFYLNSDTTKKISSVKFIYQNGLIVSK